EREVAADRVPEFVVVAVARAIEEEPHVVAEAGERRVLPDLHRHEDVLALRADDLRRRTVEEKHFRAVGGYLAELRLRDFETRVVHVAERAAGRAHRDFAAMPEVVDEGVALRVGLEHQEGVDFRAEDDRLDVAQKILEADVERGDLFLPLALAELADALAGRRLFLRGFIFRWRRGS